MFVAIDIGNTQVVIGVFEGERLKNTWRISTDHRRTADEHSLLFSSLFAEAGIKPRDADGIGISSVVPPLSRVFSKMAAKIFGKEILHIAPGIKTGMPIHYDNPAEVGSDRIANAVAAYSQARRAVIIVDFGTATTFCAVSERGEYLGGSIVPGMKIGAEALFARAAKLPRVEIVKPATAIGQTTVSSIQSGLFFGHLSMVEGMIARIVDELGYESRPMVIATGGLAQLFAQDMDTIDTVDLDLTLKGIKILYEKNRQ
ncbi:type III pantothenate kinase [bacterium]|nr:type III pantothenate kinase [bacterium]